MFAHNFGWEERLVRDGGRSRIVEMLDLSVRDGEGEALGRSGVRRVLMLHE